MLRLTLLIAISLTLSACGGGGGAGGGSDSSASGTVFQGTLTERGIGHVALETDNVPKHSAGQLIGDVKVCVMSECSITDGMGQWGVNVDNFSGGKVTITAEGHGISSSVSTEIQADAKDITINLDHNQNRLTIASISIITLNGDFVVPLNIP